MIGLLEIGVHTPGVSNLELGIEVNLAVSRVDETVQAFTRMGVAAQRRNRDFVSSRFRGKRETIIRECGRIQRGAVEICGVDTVSNEVKMALAAGRRKLDG